MATVRRCDFSGRVRARAACAASRHLVGTARTVPLPVGLGDLWQQCCQHEPGGQPTCFNRIAYYPSPFADALRAWASWVAIAHPFSFHAGLLMH